MQEEIKNIRKSIDGISKLVLEIKCSKELDKSYDSLILAKAWLGKVLAQLGSETPYKNDGNRKTVEDIEPTADTMDKDNVLRIPHKYWYENKFTYIQKVDKLRQMITDLLQQPSGIENLDKTDSDRMFRILTFMSYFNKYMEEARFWLGFELQRLKEESLESKSE